MTPDELRALADALDRITFPVMGLEELHYMETLDRTAAYLRACTEAQPVARLLHWHGPKPDPRTVIVARTFDEYSVQEADDPESYWENGEPLYTHPAPAAPQAEPKREDQPLRDLLAVIHCDGGHHTEAVGIEQSIKDAQDVISKLKVELALSLPTEAAMSINDGGPAFPQPCTEGGCSMRAYFAAKAMQPILLAAIQVAGSESRVDFAAVAKSAYRMADEMVKRGGSNE